MMMMKKVGQD